MRAGSVPAQTNSSSKTKALFVDQDPSLPNGWLVRTNALGRQTFRCFTVHLCRKPEVFRYRRASRKENEFKILAYKNTRVLIGAA
jgi:hypothetical protein